MPLSYRWWTVPCGWLSEQGPENGLPNSYLRTSSIEPRYNSRFQQKPRYLTAMSFVSPISKRAKTPTTKHSPLSSQHGGTLKISGKNHWPLSPGLLVGRTDIFCKPQPVANILRQKPAMESIQVTMCPYHHLSCLPELDIFWQWIQYTQLKRSLEIFDHLINLYVFCSIKQQRKCL